MLANRFLRQTGNLLREETMHRFRIIGIVLVLMLLITAVLISTAGASSPQPLSPDQAQVDMTSGDTVSAGTVQTVPVSTVKQVAQQPGSINEGSPPWSPNPRIGTSSNAVTATVLCYSAALRETWGTYPYQRRVTDNEYWCAPQGGNLSYRTSHVLLNDGISGLCSASGPYSFKFGGGVGYRYVYVQSGGHFACTTLGIYTIYSNPYQKWAIYAWGYVSYMGGASG
jgi:hypothetical protein